MSWLKELVERRRLVPPLEAKRADLWMAWWDAIGRANTTDAEIAMDAIIDFRIERAKRRS